MMHHGCSQVFSLNAIYVLLAYIITTYIYAVIQYIFLSKVLFRTLGACMRFNGNKKSGAKGRLLRSNFFPSYQPHGLCGVNVPGPQQKAFKGLKGNYSFLAISLFQGLRQASLTSFKLPWAPSLCAFLSSLLSPQTRLSLTPTIGGLPLPLSLNKPKSFRMMAVPCPYPQVCASKSFSQSVWGSLPIRLFPIGCCVLRSSVS